MNNIDPALRAEGFILKALAPLESERKLRLLGRLGKAAMKTWRLRRLNCKKDEIARADGTTFRVCILNGKKTEGKTVGVLWLHGGGFAVGAPEMAVLSLPRRLREAFNCVIVSPDYTLSIDRPFPAALEDAYAALLWLDRHRLALGIDAEKLVVGGESAGGGLTAALCMYALDHDFYRIGFQLPIYPMLDDRETETSRRNTAPLWNTKANRAAWSLYLNGAAGSPDLSPYAAPARRQRLEGLPPAATFIGSEEPFYAETLAFFDRLKAAGVPTACRVFPGAYHAFDMLAPYAPISREATRYLLSQYDRFTKKYIL